jgi:hypothetical protein
MTVWSTGKRAAVSRATQHKKHKAPISLSPLSLCYCLFNYACYKNEGHLTKQPRRRLLSLWCSHLDRPLSLLSLWYSARLLNPERMTFCTNQSIIVPPLTAFYRLLWQELGIKRAQHLPVTCTVAHGKRMPPLWLLHKQYVHTYTELFISCVNKLASREPRNHCYCPLKKGITDTNKYTHTHTHIHTYTHRRIV